MSRVSTFLQTIANKIREIEGSTALINPQDFVTHMNNFKMKEITPPQPTVKTCVLMISDEVGMSHFMSYTQYLEGQESPQNVYIGSGDIKEIRYVKVGANIVVNEYMINGVQTKNPSQSNKIETISFTSGGPDGKHIFKISDSVRDGEIISLKIS